MAGLAQNRDHYRPILPRQKGVDLAYFHIRTNYGPSMDHLWTIYGLSMDYLWTIYGPTMDQLWSCRQWRVDGYAMLFAEWIPTPFFIRYGKPCIERLLYPKCCGNM